MWKSQLKRKSVDINIRLSPLLDWVKIIGDQKSVLTVFLRKKHVFFTHSRKNSLKYFHQLKFSGSNLEINNFDQKINKNTYFVESC